MTEKFVLRATRNAFFFLFTLCSLSDYSPASAQVIDAGNTVIRPEAGYHLHATQLAGPFHYPWSAAFLPNNRILITEKTGQLNLVTSDGDTQKIAGVPEIFPGAEGGLLDVAVSDDFAQTGMVFLSFTYGKPGHVSVKLMRAHLDLGRRALTMQQVIFTASPDGPDNRYLGGRIALAGDFIFLTLGDRGNPVRSQRLNDDAGKIVRLHTDGSVPPDNPFAGKSGVRSEIWSYGHRNPEGLVFDRQSGVLWSTEHGPRGGDELNRISAGGNYGWPLVSFGENYDGTPVGSGKNRMEGIREPVWQWTPSVGPSGLTLEQTGKNTVIWMGALPARHISRLILHKGKSPEETVFSLPDAQRIRDVRIGPSGAIYILTDSDQGGLFRLSWRKN